MHKLMLSLANQLELHSFSAIESHLQHLPHDCEETDPKLRILKWQYTDSAPVNEQTPRYYKHIYSYFGLPTVILTNLLRNNSPAHWTSGTEDKWQSERQLVHSDLYKQKTQNFEEIYGFPLLSIQGLEWFFSNRLGGLFLSVAQSAPLGASLTPYAQTFTAVFDSTTKYDLKPECVPIKCTVNFRNLNNLSGDLYWIDAVLECQGETLRLNRHSTEFELRKMIQIVISLAIMDCSIYWHAIVAHLCISDLFTSATVTQLPCSHPLRKFLHSFTYGVFEINNVVRMVLLPDGGTLHTLFAFTAKGIQQYLDESLEKLNFLQDLSQPAVLPINVYQDMDDLWSMFFQYNVEAVSGPLKSCLTITDVSVVDAWIQEIIRLQPNEKSRKGLRAALKQDKTQLVILLLTMYMYHSVVTHDLASLTNDLVSNPFLIPTFISRSFFAANKPYSPGVQTTERVMIAAHSSDLNVLKLNHRWGDIVIPYCDLTSQKGLNDLRRLMNTLPRRLKQVQSSIEERNKERFYPNDALDIHHLRCSVSV